MQVGLWSVAQWLARAAVKKIFAEWWKRGRKKSLEKSPGVSLKPMGMQTNSRETDSIYLFRLVERKVLKSLAG